MKYSSQGKQLSIDAFRSSLDDLPKSNRWVQLGDTLPWDEIERLYNHRLNNGKRGAGNKPARMIIGTLLIKHKMTLSDEETILTIQENPYMQYFVGLSEFTDSQGRLHKGSLKIDATCADAEVRYPTDIDLLHDGCKVINRYIHKLCERFTLVLPTTHYKAARAA
jgi:hypothetical protein